MPRLRSRQLRLDQQPGFETSKRVPGTSKQVECSPNKRSDTENVENKAVESCVSPPKRPRTPHLSVERKQTLNSQQDILLRAKQRLSLGLPPKLVCRDNEQGLLHERINECISTKTAASLYLSGPPGTGKTACVRKTLTKLKDEKSDFTEVYVNCMDVRTPNAIYRLVMDGLKCSGSKPNKKPLSARQLENQFQQELTHWPKMIVLVLDEIDQLETKKHDVLYAAFRWPTFTSSRVILVGIANSLDLTERLLPKLKLGVGQKPTLMKFQPYSKDEVIRILKQRLTEADELLDPAAVELCARKVSAVTGDIRKALDICKMAIDRMERQQRPDGESEGKENGSVGRVGCRQVLDTIKQVYGSKLPATKLTLPLQQKLLLASALAITANCNQELFSLRKLCSTYRKACLAAKVQPVDQTDCLGLCQHLEAHGLLALSTSKRNSIDSQLRLLVDHRSAKAALNDEALTATVFNNVPV